MTVLRFTIPGEVKAWSRAGLGRTASGKPMHFTPKATRRNEAAWAAAAYEALRGGAPLEGPLQVFVTARFMPPKSAPKKTLAGMLSGHIFPTRRPDLDNVLKNLDGLNGVAFRDDAQVVQITAAKVYAESAGVDVTIIPMGDA